MKALVYNKDFKNKIELKETDDPKILDPKDAIIKVEVSSICTSDLHIIEGFVPRAKNNIALGHEFSGTVIETGNGVQKIKKGDRVSVNCITFCNECYFCKKGFINNCEKGGWDLGCTINGGHAEFARIPYADSSLNKIPDNLSFENALFVGDILSSGYFASKMIEIKKGDNIAIIGAGPVGLCSMVTSRILGAKKITVIDINQKRLEFASNKGFCDYIINPLIDNVEEKTKELTNKRGFDGVIEAAGGDNTFELSYKIARANSIIGVVAMYENNQILPLPNMYGKNLTFKTGGVDAIYCDELLNLISKGIISTDFLITKKFKFNDILEAYKLFKNKKDDDLKFAIYH